LETESEASEPFSKFSSDQNVQEPPKTQKYKMKIVTLHDIELEEVSEEQNH
jgi:hypothetical protein